VSGTQAGPDIEGFTFVEHLGTGGYSEVYLYERRSPRMRVAVKVLKDGRLSDGELRQFEAEAETMAELADHPYIVQVFSTDVTVDGRPYLVMKYYPPPNLGVRAAQHRLSVAEVLRTGIQISSAVETAHRAGILHRDIKPANVLVSQYGAPGLTDFGIAGRAAEAEDADDLGVSIPWSPPEVLSGSSNGSVESDVYSLGATIWHLLAGRSPFEISGGDNSPRALMTRVLRLPPPPTGRADAPASLERLLQQAMAKQESARPKTALAFARALQVIEQEQRLARTDIVVEGLGPAAARQVRSSSDKTDQTRLRAARPLAPQSRAEAAAPMPARPAPPTVARPAFPSPRPAGPPGPAAAASRPTARRHAAGGGHEPATIRRPATPAAPSPDDKPAGKRGVKLVHVAIVAAAALVIVVVVGVILATRGSDDRAEAGQPTTVATDQLIRPDPPQQPTVVAKYDAGAHVVHFTWSYENPRQDDYFMWAPKVGAAPKRVADGAAKLDLPSTRPKTTCIVVQVVRSDGQPSLYSDPVCGG